MKVNHLLMGAAVALTLAACSQENVEESMRDGNSKVVLSLQPVHHARAASAPVTSTENGGTLAVTYQSMHIVLETADGDKTVDLTGEELNAAQTKGNFTISNVRTPKRIRVYINAKNGDYTAFDGKTLALSDYYTSGLAAPLYGESQTFTRQNAREDIETVPTYQVSVTPQHRMAHIEFSGIKHKDGSNSIYQTLQLDGLFLNGIKLTEQESSVKNYVSWSDANVAENVTKEALNTDFLTAGELPGTGQCYAWNIFPGKPKLTLCFSNAKVKNAGESTHIATTRYATVTGYKDTAGQPIDNLEAGKLYRISNIVVEDKYIGDEITGATDVNVIAVVEVVNWNVVEGSVTWD